MRAILFYEADEPLMITIVAVQEQQYQWKVTVPKQELKVWIKEALLGGRLHKQDAYYWLVPEHALMRRHAHFSEQATHRQQEKMAKHILKLAYGEECQTIRLRPIDDSTEVAICGLKKSYSDECVALLGNYQRWFYWASYSEWQLFSHQGIPEDGYYALESMRWTTVVVVYHGQVIDGRTILGHQENVLLEALTEENANFGIKQNLQWCSMENDEATVFEAIKETRLAKMQAVSGINVKGNRLFIALCILCLLIPGVLLLAGPSNDEASSMTENSAEEASNGVVHSDYSTLLAEAYAAKGERIVLSNHQAADGALSITGRCSETLDLADYMKQLEASDKELHPLLLDMVLKTDDQQSYYEFVVQIGVHEDGEE